jgi:hypothetical protein
MSYTAIGVYREPQFSPGKVAADAAIMDAALAELAREGIESSAIDADQFAGGAGAPADVVLAMCQGEAALTRLAEVERAGAVVINPALAIRNCYRDLLAPGLARAGVPTPAGALVETGAPIDPRVLAGIDLTAPVYVKRGDLHALSADDVQQVVGRAELERRLADFARRGIRLAYVQQEFAGRVVKFYGVSGGGFFSALSDDGEIPEAAIRELSQAGITAAAALGLETWGGDAILSDGGFAIIDFNDWPSYTRVRGAAARAIARRALQLLARTR